MLNPVVMLQVNHLLNCNSIEWKWKVLTVNDLEVTKEKHSTELKNHDKYFSKQLIRYLLLLAPIAL